jgi:hypothetical protein
MFMRLGCGCVVLVVSSEANNWNRESWIARKIEDCRGDDDRIPWMGAEEPLSNMGDKEQIAKAVAMTPEECRPYLDKMAALIRKGHQLNELRSAFRPLLAEED